MNRLATRTGDRHGMLTCIQPDAGRMNDGHVKGLWRCDCGIEKLGRILAHELANDALRIVGQIKFKLIEAVDHLIPAPFEKRSRFNLRTSGITVTLHVWLYILKGLLGGIGTHLADKLSQCQFGSGRAAASILTLETISHPTERHLKGSVTFVERKKIQKLLAKKLEKNEKRE